MALIAPQKTVIAGTTITYAAANAGGDTIAPNDRGALHVKNGGGAAITVTVVDPGLTAFAQANPDPTVSVPAAGEKAIGPFPTGLADATTGLINITYSGVTTVTVAYVTV